MEEKNKKKWPENLRDWQKSQSETYRTYIKTSAVGLEFALAIGISALIGYYLDQRFGGSPWGLIIGMLIGVLAGVKRLWIFSKEYLKKSDSDDDPT
jgi:F0F1-type ATP synthase assembly protein I